MKHFCVIKARKIGFSKLFTIGTAKDLKSAMKKLRCLGVNPKDFIRKMNAFRFGSDIPHTHPTRMDYKVIRGDKSRLHALSYNNTTPKKQEGKK